MGRHTEERGQQQVDQTCCTPTCGSLRFAQRGSTSTATHTPVRDKDGKLLIRAGEVHARLETSLAGRSLWRREGPFRPSASETVSC